MSPKLILVVEDDEDIRAQVTMALEIEDYEVATARNGREGLEYLVGRDSSAWPACIILDLMMPEMDGRTFMTILHRDHADGLAKIPIIVATAKGSAVNPATLPFEFDRVQKPFNLDELYETVRRNCRV